VIVTIAIVTLSATTAGAAFFAWRQQRIISGAADLVRKQESHLAASHLREDGMRQQINALRNQVAAVEGVLDARTARVAHETHVAELSRKLSQGDHRFAIGGQSIVDEDGFAHTDIFAPDTRVFVR